MNLDGQKKMWVFAGIFVVAFRDSESNSESDAERGIVQSQCLTRAIVHPSFLS